MNLYGFRGIPLEAQYRLRQGRELAGRGNDSSALACFKQVVFIAPGFSGAFKETGDCLSRLGRHDEAAVYYKKAHNGGSCADE